MSNQISQAELLRSVFREFSKSLSTSIPGHVLAFDPVDQLAQLQIGIQTVSTSDKVFTPAPIIECPVNFPGGATFSLEYKVEPGTEGLIVFSQRCIEGWINNGEVAQNTAIRFHNINDAMFIPGIRSKPKKLSNFQNNGIRMRNNDGSKYVWLKDDGTADITVTTLFINGNIIHTGNTNQTGNTTVSQFVESPAFNGTGGTGTMSGMQTVTTNEAVINGVNHSTHIHSQPNDGGGDAEQDTGGPHA